MEHPYARMCMYKQYTRPRCALCIPITSCLLIIFLRSQAQRAPARQNRNVSRDICVETSTSYDSLRIISRTNAVTRSRCFAEKVISQIAACLQQRRSLCSCLSLKRWNRIAGVHEKATCSKRS